MTSKAIKGHIWSSFHLKIGLLFYLFFFENLILSKFVMNANIIKRKIFNNMKFDLIITLTYVLMDNFCFISVMLACQNIISTFNGNIFYCRVKVQNLKYIRKKVYFNAQRYISFYKNNNF